MSDSEKYSYIDVIKGIGILFVIVGHSDRPDMVLKLIQCFHMPLFFVLSGYLYNKNKYWGDLRGLSKVRFKSYIVPYIKFATFNYLVVFVYNLHTIEIKTELIDVSVRYLVGLIYSRGTWYWMPNCSPLWFLTAIFVTSILFYFVMKYDIKKQVAFIIAFAIIGASFEWFNIMKIFWNVDSAFTGCVFMWIGYYLRNDITLLKKINIPIAVILVIIGLCAGYFNDIDFVSMDSVIYGNTMLMYVGAVSLSIVIFFIAFKFIRKNSFLELYGRNTILILGLNYLVNDMVEYVWGKFILTDDSLIWLYQCVLEIIILGIICVIWEKIKPLSVYKRNVS